MKEEGKVAHRLFYLALPPTEFVKASRGIHTAPASSPSGWTRTIVEKPFGFDTESSKALVSSIAQYWNEEQTYRIDHYLGKEMVQNLMILRFGNMVFDPIWNYQYIKNVTITFKEDIDCEGRAGVSFEEFCCSGEFIRISKTDSIVSNPFKFFFNNQSFFSSSTLITLELSEMSSKIT